ncbi:UDP-glucose 4-epimerase GalE [Pelagibius litoralis]|uniref:UDP-glucose 4-epimerase n=1 Tax=Pelagibius litoralis TaxID=374515 RepID=A0A967C3K9_9PROT|nr:UDP-glucose 4-epimerase GalE [Pelagibius litoralis]NIA67635.1 UDP-glucose 4-epimerase GalE [Pelagibius litoralis]
MASETTTLVTGGAGYIGSHAVLALRQAGRRVVVLDDLSAGSRTVVPDDVPFVEGNAGDPVLVGRLLRDFSIGSVIHFAGSILVERSVSEPLSYYHNNVTVSRNLLEACLQGGVKQFIFSSTAAVYGAAAVSPIPESTPTKPINPYGTSKLVTEWMLRDLAAASDLRFVALRYFNVAGADPQGRSGQLGPVATHLVKIASQVIAGTRESIAIFGDDYDTPDGTCVRDYIHVSDLASAHLSALSYLEAGGESRFLNCGYGHGYSVREVLQAVERCAGRSLNARRAPRRPGDPPTLVADTGALQKTLSWTPRFDNIDVIINTAIDWELSLGLKPDGDGLRAHA